MRKWMRRAVPVLLGLLVAAVAGGCYLGHLLVAVTKPDERKEIKAEYNLEADTLAIVCYCGTDILFMNPTVPIEVSNDLVSEVLTHLKPKVRQIINPVKVVQWQDSNLDWTNMSTVDIAKAFEADTLLYVELEQYSTVEERSANLFRGHIRATVQVVKPGAAVNPVYRAPIEVSFPEGRPVGVVEGEAQIRRGTSVVFARTIMKKFYDREVIIKGGVEQ
jgi:hypothetical protein